MTKCDIFFFSTVDGWHGEWGAWGYCSKSCGPSGFHHRYRRCNNPAPKFGGLECPEESLVEIRPCPKPSCDSKLFYCGLRNLSFDLYSPMVCCILLNNVEQIFSV